MQKNFVKELLNIYANGGLFDKRSCLESLQQLKKAYPEEARKIYLAAEQGIVTDMLKKKGNAPEDINTYLYINDLMDRYALSYEDSEDIVNTLSYVFLSKEIVNKAAPEHTTKDMKYEAITKIALWIAGIIFAISLAAHIYNSSDDNIFKRFTKNAETIVLGIEPSTIDMIGCEMTETNIVIDGESMLVNCLRDKEGRYYAPPSVIEKIWQNATDIKEVKRFGISSAKKRKYEDNFYQIDFYVFRKNKSTATVHGIYEINGSNDNIYIDLKEVVVDNLAYRYYIDKYKELITILRK